MLGMAAWQRGQAFGIKLATVFPGNAAHGQPTIASVYVLFDGTDGTPRAVIDATPLTVRKTAADSALAADYLARPDARTLLMVGAGAQARMDDRGPSRGAPIARPRADLEPHAGSARSNSPPVSAPKPSPISRPRRPRPT